MRILFLSERSHGEFDMLNDEVGRPFFLAKYLSKYADLTWALLTDRSDVPAIERRDLGFGTIDVHNVRARRGPLLLRYPGYFRRVLKLSKKRGPHVAVLTREMGEIVCGIASSRLRGIPWVVDFADSYATYHYGLNQPGPQTWVIRNSSFFSCASPSLREMILEINPRAEAFLLPNGYEPDSAPGAPKAALRSRLGVPEDAKVVLYAGQIRTSKGIDTLLEALRLARDAIPERIVLFLVGPLMGAETTFAMNLLDVTGTVGAVPRSEALRWMRAADIGVLPYPATQFSYYGFPLKLFEFLSSGLRVVATPTPSATWAASQFPEVSLARGYDAQAIAAALIDALRAPSMSERSSFEAFEWDRMVDRFSRWLESRVLAQTV